MDAARVEWLKPDILGVIDAALSVGISESCHRPDHGALKANLDRLGLRTPAESAHIVRVSIRVIASAVAVDPDPLRPDRRISPQVDTRP